MRAIERAAIATGAVTGRTLMERAGRGVVDALLTQWPAMRDGPRRAAVLCGPGNNGGDGFVVARLLRDRGWRVDLHSWGRAADLPPDARANADLWMETGALRDWPEGGDWADGADLVVDAVLGTGLVRPVPAAMHAPLRAASERGLPLVAVDGLTGLDLDTGAMRIMGGSPARADLTVTFHAAKVGHYLADGPARSGRLVVTDIGLDPVPGADDAPSCRLVDLSAGDAARCLRKTDGHKYDHGHVLVLSGGVGRGGAARMAARGALRIGAGLVTLACPPAALIENAAQLDAIMLRAVKDEGALTDLLGDPRLDTLCLGPGLGLTAREAGLLRAALRVGRGTVLDGDALTLLARDDDLFSLLHECCVLTPHAGEFARLFPDLADRLAKDSAFSKLDAARQAALRAGCTVLVKGPDTVIAGPDGQAALAPASYGRAVPWLATAGAGDVLSGFIAGLLARGFDPMRAAETGAWLHVECARQLGAGMIAQDLPDALPRVFARLGL